MQQNTSAYTSFHLNQGTNQNDSVLSHMEKTNANDTPSGDIDLILLTCQDSDLTI